MSAEPSLSSAYPRLFLSDRQTADLQLFIDGVELPWAMLGGSLLDERRADQASRADVLGLAVDDEQAATVVAAGGALLCDREQTPLATLTAPTVVEAPSADRASCLHGRITAERQREARLLGPSDSGPLNTGDGARLVIVERPPLLGELAALTAENRPVVVLVPAETLTPDGLPPSVLLECTRRAAAIESPGAVVRPVALFWRDHASNRTLIEHVGKAYGDPAPVVLGSCPRWADVLGALDRGTPISADVASALQPTLTSWRPPRSRRGLVVLFTGLSGSGKSTLARGLAEHAMWNTDRTVSLLDGDDVRRLLSAGLGFDRADRDLNVRRIGYVAAEVARHGGLAVCAPIAPYAESRAAVREMVRAHGGFVLVHVATPLEECERRDLKGLYARARAGQVKGFTGIDDPYEPPDDADLVIDTSTTTRERALELVLDHLTTAGWLRPRSAAR